MPFGNRSGHRKLLIKDATYAAFDIWRWEFDIQMRPVSQLLQTLRNWWLDEFSRRFWSGPTLASGSILWLALLCSILFDTLELGVLFLFDALVRCSYSILFLNALTRFSLNTLRQYSFSMLLFNAFIQRSSTTFLLNAYASRHNVSHFRLAQSADLSIILIEFAPLRLMNLLDCCSRFFNLNKCKQSTD